MTVFQTVGMAWVIFTSALATVAILYLAYIGLAVSMRHGQIRVYSVDVDGAESSGIKTLPVSWGRKEDRRVVEVGVGGIKAGGI